MRFTTSIFLSRFPNFLRAAAFVLLTGTAALAPVHAQPAPLQAVPALATQPQLETSPTLTQVNQFPLLKQQF